MAASDTHLRESGAGGGRVTRITWTPPMSSPTRSWLIVRNTETRFLRHGPSSSWCHNTVLLKKGDLDFQEFCLKCQINKETTEKGERNRNDEGGLFLSSLSASWYLPGTVSAILSLLSPVTVSSPASILDTLLKLTMATSDPSPRS